MTATSDNNMAMQLGISLLDVNNRDRNIGHILKRKERDVTGNYERKSLLKAFTSEEVS